MNWNLIAILLVVNHDSVDFYFYFVFAFVRNIAIASQYFEENIFLTIDWAIEYLFLN